MIKALKEILIENKFNVNEIIENVLLIENFISNEELKGLFKIIDTTNEKDWFYLYTAGLKTFCLEKFGSDDVDSLVAEGKFEVTVGWEDKNLDISMHQVSREISKRLQKMIDLVDPNLILNGFGSFQRMQSGVQLKSHADQHTDPSIQYAAILYLNDDYTDGEFFFEKKQFEIRPKPGSLLIFPGNEEFEHGVRYVGDGKIRYVIPAFIKIKNFYVDNKY
jgi:hypothetical protein